MPGLPAHPALPHDGIGVESSGAWAPLTSAPIGRPGGNSTLGWRMSSESQAQLVLKPCARYDQTAAALGQGSRVDAAHEDVRSVGIRRGERVTMISPRMAWSR
jgi:hypothetical protein